MESSGFQGVTSSLRSVIAYLLSVQKLIPGRKGTATKHRQPSQVLFSRIRLRLAIWYTTVIAVVLIVSGVFLYFEVENQLLGPMKNILAGKAQAAVQLYQIAYVQQQTQLLVAPPCDVTAREIMEQDPNTVVACYDTKLNISGPHEALNPQLKPFFSANLARSVASGGTATDTVSTSIQGEDASIQRYAIAIPNPQGGRNLGFIQVGLPFGDQSQALSTLLDLLLILGAVIILLSIGAGLFLASRALQPARIAYTRQRDFIADASHELRTPLTMLRSTVEFVLRGREHLTADDVALLEDTVEETTHLTQLANNMLDLARLDSETFHIEEDVVDLGEIAVEVTRWSQALAKERGITITATVAQPALVLGDASLLLQSLLVLVDNAIKYNRPSGTVSVTVSRDGDNVVVEVVDTGIGVAAVDLNRLGERFYRVDKARSRESGGAGLGLSIVRSIIARHNGTFDITSEQGSGTQATIHLGIVSERRLSPIRSGLVDDDAGDNSASSA